MSTQLVTAAAPATQIAVAPTFLVGHDIEGHWLAVETHGMGGGVFVSREAALGYARSESGRRPGGVEITSTTISLRRD